MATSDWRSGTVLYASDDSDQSAQEARGHARRIGVSSTTVKLVRREVDGVKMILLFVR